MAGFVPYFSYRDAGAALDWPETAFGFERTWEYRDDSGTVIHAELRFGDGSIMLGSGEPPARARARERDVAAAHGVYVVVDVDGPTNAPQPRDASSTARDDGVLERVASARSTSRGTSGASAATRLIDSRAPPAAVDAATAHLHEWRFIVHRRLIALLAVVAALLVVHRPPRPDNPRQRLPGAGTTAHDLEVDPGTLGRSPPWASLRRSRPPSSEATYSFPITNSLRSRFERRRPAPRRHLADGRLDDRQADGLRHPVARGPAVGKVNGRARWRSSTSTTRTPGSISAAGASTSAGRDDADAGRG